MLTTTLDTKHAGHQKVLWGIITIMVDKTGEIDLSNRDPNDLNGHLGVGYLEKNTTESFFLVGSMFRDQYTLCT